MKLIIASDSFKGSLSSNQVNNIIESKVKEIFPKSFCEKMLIADGGEGTLEAIYGESGNGYDKIVIDTVNPLGKKIDGYYLRKGNIAVIEMAQASGLTLIDEKEKNPMITTSFGTGIFIKHAIENGCTKIYIGIGGSATNDGGIGAMIALGYRFLDSEGNELLGIGENLEKIATIDDTFAIKEISEVETIVMCDVTNTLTGEKGATYVYGPQKGGTEEKLEKLEKGMISYRKILEEYLGHSIEEIEGLGAAGGLGAALYGFLNGKMQSGIDVLLELNNFEEKLDSTDIVITGEGKTDYQSACGKVIHGIARKCKKHNVPVLVISGSLGEEINQLYSMGVSGMEASVCNIISLNNAMDNAEKYLCYAAERVLRVLKTGMELVQNEKI